MSVAHWLSDLIWQHSADNPPVQPITMVEISRLRLWLRRDFGMETTFVIERRGERNRVALRFFLAHGTGDIEAGWLRDLRKKALGRAQTRRRLEAKLQERECERDTRTVA